MPTKPPPSPQKQRLVSTTSKLPLHYVRPPPYKLSVRHFPRPVTYTHAILPQMAYE